MRFELAGVDLDAEVVARAEHVLLLDRRRQRQLVGRREAGAEQQVAGRLLLDRDRQVDLVGRARHLVGVDVDFAEVAEAVDAVARQLDLARRRTSDDSNWRNSRRTTSSRVRVLPATLMRRT